MAQFTPVYLQTPQGLNILLHKPSGGIQRQGLLGPVTSEQYKVQLKLQLIAQKSNDEAWVFPAPTVEDTSVFSNADHTPDFSNDDQAFWLYKEWA